MDTEVDRLGTEPFQEIITGGKFPPFLLPSHGERGSPSLLGAVYICLSGGPRAKRSPPEADNILYTFRIF